MSKVILTKNLGLTTYSGAVLTPFEKDVSSNFSIVDERVGQNATEASQLDARMEAAEDDIMQIRETTETHTALITAMRADVDKNTEEIAVLKPEGIDDLRDRVEALGEMGNTNANLIQALTVRIADDEDNLAQHAIRIGNLEALLPTLQTAISTIREAINQIAAELEEAKKEIVDSQGDIAALDADMSDVKTTVEGFNTQFETIGVQLENISANYANLQARQSDTESKVINLDGRVKALEEK